MDGQRAARATATCMSQPDIEKVDSSVRLQKVVNIVCIVTRMPKNALHAMWGENMAAPAFAERKQMHAQATQHKATVRLTLKCRKVCIQDCCRGR